jgi:hypothetical protein
MDGEATMETHDGYDIYLLAGVATRPGFFTDCERRLTELCSEQGWAGSGIHILYPYGDYSRSLARQIHEVRRDLLRRRKRYIGGTAAAGEVRTAASGRQIVLIGHSGGGVAAYHAGRLLLEEGVVPDCRIVQIGSPRVRIAEEHRDKVSYFYAVNGEGKRNDRVTRLGSWGGFRRSSYGVPVWDSYRYAPGHIDAIPVVGGHADYFRGCAPFVHEDVTNLQRTIGSVWQWLSGSGSGVDRQRAATGGL